MKQIEHIVYPKEKPFLCPVCDEGDCELERYGFAPEDIEVFMAAVDRADLRAIQSWIENTSFVEPVDEPMSATERRKELYRAADLLHEIARHIEGI